MTRLTKVDLTFTIPKAYDQTGTDTARLAAVFKERGELVKLERKKTMYKIHLQEYLEYEEIIKAWTKRD